MTWKFQIVYPDTTTVTINEPVGWDAIGWSAKRNPEHHGIFFSISTDSFQFKGDAFNALVTLYDADGANAKLNLLITYQCEEGEAYQDFFNGSFDFNTYKRECGDYCFVSISVIASTCVDKFLNRIEQKVNPETETDFDGNAITPLASTDVILDGQDILLQNKADNEPDGTNFGGTFCLFPGTGTGGAGQKVYLPVPLQFTRLGEIGIFNANGVGQDFVKDAGTGVALDVFTQPFTQDLYDRAIQFLTIYTPQNLTENCIEPNADFEYNLNGTLSFTTEFSGSMRIAVRFTMINMDTGANGDIDAVDIFPFTAMAAGDSFSFPFSVAVAASPVYTNKFAFCLYFEFIATNTNAGALCENIDVAIDWEAFGDNNFSMTSDSTCPQTTTKAWNLVSLLQFAHSVYANGCFADLEYPEQLNNYYITNGGLIRQVTTPNLFELFYSFFDLFENANKILNIGWGFTDNEASLKIGNVEDFYTSNVVANVGSVDKVEFAHDRSRTFAIIKVGYTKWEAEEYNGLDEMNTSREYRVNEVDSSKTEMDLLSNIVSAGYTIEITRRKNQAKTGTSDWRYDNDLFIINTDGNDPLAAYRGVDANASNIYSPTTRFNYILTPVRNMMRWFKSIFAQRPDYATGALVFNSGDGNYKAEGQMTVQDPIESVTMNESELVEYAEITSPQADPIWKTVTQNFTAPLSMVQRATIVADPYGCVQFECNGTTHKGNIIEIDFKPNDGLATFKLLERRD